MRKLLFLLCLIPINLGAGGIDYDGSDDITTCGSASALDDLTAKTAKATIRPDSLGTEYAIVYKMVSGGTDGLFFYLDSNGALNCGIDLDTSDALSVTSNNTIWTNAYFDVFCAWSSGTAPDIFVRLSTGTAALSEASYASETAGSGGLVSEASGNLSVGSRTTLPVPFDGVIGEVCFWNSKLTLALASQASNNERFACISVSPSNLVLYAPFDDQPIGTSANGDTFFDRKSTNNCTGDDGANNTGLTMAGNPLSYP